MVKLETYNGISKKKQPKAAKLSTIAINIPLEPQKSIVSDNN